MPSKFFNVRRRTMRGIVSRFKTFPLFARKCHFISCGGASHRECSVVEKICKFS